MSTVLELIAVVAAVVFIAYRLCRAESRSQEILAESLARPPLPPRTERRRPHIYFDQAFPLDERQRLATFLTSIMGIEEEGDYLESIRAATEFDELREALIYGSGVVIVTNPDPESDPLSSLRAPQIPSQDEIVSKLISRASFFWCCIRNAPQIVELVETCKAQSVPPGILPSDKTLKTLQLLHQRYPWV